MDQHALLGPVVGPEVDAQGVGRRVCTVPEKRKATYGPLLAPYSAPNVGVWIGIKSMVGFEIFSLHCSAPCHEVSASYSQEQKQD